MGIRSSMRSIVDVTDPMRSYWSLVLASGKSVSEQSLIFDLRAGGLRPLDWSLDMVSTGDIYKIRTLTLHCPNRQSATLTIEEPGTVFQLKIASMSVLSAGSRVQSHLIGKVVDKEQGLCRCHIWDRELGLIDFTSSVYRFGSWRPGVLPLGALSLDVLGLRLS
jgi:hypothetical protein